MNAHLTSEIGIAHESYLFFFQLISFGMMKIPQFSSGPRQVLGAKVSRRGRVSKFWVLKLVKVLKQHEFPRNVLQLLSGFCRYSCLSAIKT
mgnify:CR=1 FL=1